MACEPALDVAAAPPQPIARLVDTQAGPALRWEMRHRPSLSPAQALATLSVFAASGGVGAAAGWLLGRGGLSTAFALEAAVAVGLFMRYARHAGDREVVTLSGRQLEVERWSGARAQRDAFDVAWVRVACSDDTGYFVDLSQRQSTVRLGRHLGAADRHQVALELRRAIHHRKHRPV